jgi:hypothetical protein
MMLLFFKLLSANYWWICIEHLQRMRRTGMHTHVALCIPDWEAAPIYAFVP